MAEVETGRETRGPRWPWVLGLGTVALVIVGVLLIYDREAVVEAGDPIEQLEAPVSPGAPVSPAAEARAPDAPPPAVVPQVEDFFRECTGVAGPPARFEEPQRFTAVCFERMAGAISAVAAVEFVELDVEQVAQQLVRSADRLRRLPPGHADEAVIAVQAMRNASDALAPLVAERPDRPDLDRAAQRIGEAADAMQDDVSLMEQRLVLVAYFQAVGAALQAAVR